jgi:cytochrome c oxidase cbb3-type subunit III
MKKLILFGFTMASGISAFAQEANSASFWSDPVNHPMAPFYGLIALVLVVIVLVMAVAIAMIRVLNTLSERVAQERAQRLGIEYKPRPSFWSRFVKTVNDSVPLEEEEKIELDHNYDGIKELDNHLPPWWKWLFYGTIGWAAVYMIVYHYSGTLPLMEQEYKNELTKAEEVKRKFLATQPKVEIDENTLTYSADAAIIAKGKDIYAINCSPCHKNDGGGGIGPNLTDEYWIHGGDIKNIFATVKNGVPEKGMVSWASVLSPEQLRDVSFFVMSLKGSNPPGAKAPQGTPFTPAVEEVKSDSSKAQAAL